MTPPANPFIQRQDDDGEEDISAREHAAIVELRGRVQAVVNAVGGAVSFACLSGKRGTLAFQELEADDTAFTARVIVSSRSLSVTEVRQTLA